MKLSYKDQVLKALYDEYQKDIPDMEENVRPTDFGKGAAEFFVALKKLDKEGLIRGAKISSGGMLKHPIDAIWQDVIVTHYGAEYIESKVGRKINKEELERKEWVLIKIYEECKKDIPDQDIMRESGFYDIKADEWKTLPIAIKKLQTEGYIEGVEFWSSSRGLEGNKVTPSILQISPESHIALTRTGIEKAEEILGIRKPLLAKQMPYIQTGDKNIINFGNHNIINQQIQKGDIEGIKAQLKKLGVTEEEVTELVKAAEKDKTSSIVSEIGDEVKNWIKCKTGDLLDGTVKFGVQNLPTIIRLACAVAGVKSPDQPA